MNPQVFREGAVVLVSVTKGPWLATYSDPFNNTIGQSFFTKCATNIKIPYLLYEKKSF